MPIVFGAGAVPQQDAAPASPVVGQVWRETDTNVRWYWDGSNWLSCTLYSLQGYVNTAVGVARPFAWTPAVAQVVYDLELVDFITTHMHSSDDTANKYWTSKLIRATAANSGTVISTISTQGVTASSWEFTRTALGVRLGYESASLDAPILYIGIDIVSTPGALEMAHRVTYRWVHA